MPRFFLKLALILAPLAAVCGFPSLVLWRAGELMSIDQVLDRQLEGGAPLLYGPAYSARERTLKLQAVLRRRPRVIALGSSRVMQLRSAMFTSDARFYNAGMGVETIRDLREFVNRIPASASPRVLLVGIDQWLFTAAAEGLPPQRGAAMNATGIIQTARRRVYADYRAGKFSVRSLLEKDADGTSIGLQAIANQNGFRGDGSFFYGEDIAARSNPAHADVEFTDTLRWLEEGGRHFSRARDISSAALRDLDAFLSLCASRGIHVVGFLPPYAHAVYARMVPDGAGFEYLSRIEPAAAPLFARHGATFFDFTDLARAGASDAETIDGIHASESANLRMLLAMAAHDPKLRAEMRPLHDLEARLAAAPNLLLVFRNDEF